MKAKNSKLKLPIPCPFCGSKWKRKMHERWGLCFKTTHKKECYLGDEVFESEETMWPHLEDRLNRWNKRTENIK